MLHQSFLTPAHALPVPREIPTEIRGTRQAIFYLLRRPTVPSGQAMATPARAPRGPAALLMDADHFVFQF